MSDQFSPSSASSGPGSRNPDGVRTYRGRTIEELIPRIRAELGPDAIILREREGLTGGIGGFFAQRCVEIDAQAAPRVNVYAGDLDDDEYEDEDEDERGEEGYEDERGEEEYEDFKDDHEAPEQATVPFPAATAPEEPEPEPEPEPAALAPPAARASAPFMDEASFAARLEEATFAVEEKPEAEAEEEAAPTPPTVAETPSFIAFDELIDEETAPAEDQPGGFAEPEPAEPASSEPAPDDADETQPAEAAAAAEPAEPALGAREPLVPAPWLTFAEEQEAAATAPDPAPTPSPEPSSYSAALPAGPQTAAPAQAAAPPPVMSSPAPRPASAESAPAVAPAPSDVSAPSATAPAPSAAAPGALPVQATRPPARPAPYGYGVRRRGGLLPAAERMLRAALDATAAANERRELEYQARLAARPAPPFASPPAAAAPAASVPALTAPSPAPGAASAIAPGAGERAGWHAHRRDAELERRLVACGFTPSRAAALVGAAISQRGPFSGGGALADDVRATVAMMLPAPHLLPVDQGAVAIIGAGGSGKTRCVAALAAAHARAGALVSVASLGAPGREDELGALLHGEAVNIIPAMRTRATARAVGSARERGLVIIDTAAVAPGDGPTIDVIAEALHSFGLDGIYLAVPATLSSPAGATLIDGFSAFDLTGLVATHVDETDQLGVIAELSMLTGIPLSYTHAGLDLQNAITPADPEQIAAQLLR